jgi:hypothetical protein
LNVFYEEKEDPKLEKGATEKVHASNALYMNPFSGGNCEGEELSRNLYDINKASKPNIQFAGLNFPPRRITPS